MKTTAQRKNKRLNEKNIKSHITSKATQMVAGFLRPVDETVYPTLLSSFFLVFLFGVNQKENESAKHDNIIPSHSSMIGSNLQLSTDSNLPIDNTTASIVN